MKESEYSKGVVLLLTPLHPYLSENEPDCITLSSDEEMQGDEEQWRKNVMDHVIVKKGDKTENEKEVGSFQDDAKLVKNRITKFTKRGKRNDGAIIVRGYSLQEKAEIVEQQNICKYCAKKMKTQKSLAEHIRKEHESHTELSLLKCETCGEKMRSKYLLQYHQKIHSNERLFGCNLCQLKFKSQFNLDKHFSSNGHKDSEFVQQQMKNELAVQDLTPPSPLLSAEISLDEVEAGLSDTNLKSTSIDKSSTENSTLSPPQIQSPSTSSSGGVSFPMTHNLQPIPTPVLFYGYMIQPNCNGASFSMEHPPVIQSFPYSSPLCSGIVSPQAMQLMPFQANPYFLTSYSQQPS